MTREVPWYDDDKGFCDLLERAHRWQRWLAVRWSQMGLRSTPLIGPVLATRQGGVPDGGDMRIDLGMVEVKTRTLSFTSPESYPFADAYVGRVGSWETRDTPVAVAIISEPTRAVIIVPGSTRPLWITQQSFDNFRGCDVTSFSCPREHIITEDAFLEWALRTTHAQT